MYYVSPVRDFEEVLAHERKAGNLPTCPSAAEQRASRQELINDPVIRRLMPWTVRHWEGSQEDADYELLLAEDVCYGQHLHAGGDAPDGVRISMFGRRCTAAAIKHQRRIDEICESIIQFDLERFWEGICQQR